ncbi:unnamed protein product [Chrysoparadoxa australica]
MVDEANRFFVHAHGLLRSTKDGHAVRNFKINKAPVSFRLLTKRKKIVKKKVKRRRKVAFKKKGKGPGPAKAGAAGKGKEGKKKKKKKAKAPAKAAKSKTSRRSRGAGQAAEQAQVQAAPAPNFLSRGEYPKLPRHSRVSFDFAHALRPPPHAVAVAPRPFNDLVNQLITNPSIKDASTEVKINALRSLSHLFFFTAEQIAELMLLLSRNADIPSVEAAEEEDLPLNRTNDEGVMREVLVSLHGRCTDEHNMAVCLDMLSEEGMEEMEERLGKVALFMPTDPDGDYKLDLKQFEDRQIAKLLTGLDLNDVQLVLLGLSLDAEAVQGGSSAWEDDVPTQGKLRCRVRTRRAFRPDEEVLASHKLRHMLGALYLGWSERVELVPPVSDNSAAARARRRRAGTRRGAKRRRSSRRRSRRSVSKRASGSSSDGSSGGSSSSLERCGSLGQLLPDDQVPCDDVEGAKQLWRMRRSNPNSIVEFRVAAPPDKPRDGLLQPPPVKHRLRHSIHVVTGQVPFGN